MVKQIKVGPIQNFVYLVVDESTREAMAIDSGWETEPIVKLAKQEGTIVKYAVVTHEHFDHTETIYELADELGAEVISYEASSVQSHRRVRDGEIIMLGDTKVKVLHTPGHTEDSICLYDGKNLFTGDTLFIGSWGRTDLAGGSARKLFHSIHSVIMKLPLDTIIYPGHDYGDVPFRKLGDELDRNSALTARNIDEFLALLS
jgi:glyoxylase-like metal-dependent hydrolase (beta-lactamase superfamily II)